MREYELLYVLAPTTEDEAAEALQQRFAQTITSTGGEVIAVNPWGKRRLAYEISRFKEGIYVQVRFNADTGTPAEIDRVLKYAEPVLRHIIVRADDLDPALSSTIPDQLPDPGSEEWNLRGRGRFRDQERAQEAQAAPAEGEAAPEGQQAASNGEAAAEGGQAAPQADAAGAEADQAAPPATDEAVESEAPEEAGVADAPLPQGNPEDDTASVLQSPSQAEGADDESAEPQGDQEDQQA